VKVVWRPTVDEIEQLYERHAKHLEATHWGKFLALAPDGRYLVGDDDVAVFVEAIQQFGQGNFVLLRIGEKDVDILRQVGFATSSARYPFVEVEWEVHMTRHRDWAYADTGFEGFLTIPMLLTPLLGNPQGSIRTRMADGSVSITGAYFGTVEIVGINEPIPARILVLGNEFLLGRRVLDRYKVTFDRGLQVVVEKV
jgi:predicted aspartyl protease